MHIVVNLKAYACDAAAIAAAAAEHASDETAISVVPQAPAIAATAAIGADTWAQHVDPIDHGSHTGTVHATAAAQAGATGTLLNHSERRLKLADIDKAIQAADRAGLLTCVCANTPAQTAAVTALGPDMVAIEPPGLIGGDVSVATADPDIVRDAVTAASTVDPSVAVYCGAGVSSAADIAAAADLGATGVLLASGVAKATDPAAALGELIDS
jgi:triosephosphate isomerase (EC 5.3.1.1)